MFVFGVIKGATLANAAFVLATLIPHPNELKARSILWLASGAAMLVAYTAMLRGILLATVRVNALDSILPFVMSISEFLLFSALQYSGAELDWSHLWHPIFAIHLLTAMLLVLNRWWLTRESDVEEILRPLTRGYRRWLLRDASCAAVLGTLWIGVAWLSQTERRLVDFGFGLLATLAMATIILLLYRDYRRILTFMEKADRTSQGSGLPVNSSLESTG